MVDAPDYQRLIGFVMHELRLIQQRLDTSATEISVAINARSGGVDTQRISSNAEKLQEEILVLRSWLSIVDFYIDPDAFIREPKFSISLYRLFDKARISLKSRAKKREIRIHMIGQGEFLVNAHPILSVVPYIVLDNALKYAPRGSTVDIELGQSQDRTVVSVRSPGPRVLPEELAAIREPGVRGMVAEAVIGGGQGLGLAILDAICRYHEAEMQIVSAGPTWTVNEREYGQFTVTLIFRS